MWIKMCKKSAASIFHLYSSTLKMEEQTLVPSNKSQGVTSHEAVTLMLIAVGSSNLAQFHSDMCSYFVFRKKKLHSVILSRVGVTLDGVWIGDWIY
jgi:hypothetical protein